MNLRESSLIEPLDSRSLEVRQLILKAIAASGRGHLGPSLSLVEIISTLYDSVLTHDPKNSNWEERDILILSKGHGCLALYAVLAQHGYFPVEELETFCNFESRLGGHPEWNDLPGIEFSTGSLGHGLAVGVGIARAFQIQNKKQKVFVILGDGELGEGSIWESAAHASKYNLSHLYAIVDFNAMQAYGALETVLPIQPIAQKWDAFGFKTYEINGHNRNQIISAIKEGYSSDKPKAIIASTIKGKGIKVAENSSTWHHKAKINSDEIASISLELK